MINGIRAHFGQVVSIVACALLSACGSGGAPGTGAGSGSVPGTGSATLSWEAPTANFDLSCLNNLSGYRVLYGTTSGRYTHKKDMGLAEVTCTATGVTGSCGPVQACSARITGLDAGTWYFAVTAINTDGDSGIVSGEVVTQVTAN